MADVEFNRPFIRPYNPDTDFDDAVHVFRETCDASLRSEPAWTIGSYLWCRPYVREEPRTCFVVDDGRGKAVGYIIGTPNTERFNAAWKAHFLPNVEHELKAIEAAHAPLDDRSKALLEAVRDPWKANYGKLREELQPWAGHLHIDILPAYQSQGLGKHLLRALFDAVKAQGCNGIYLGMTAQNDGAGRFYARNGFRRLPHVLDSGKSGEEGRSEAPEGGHGVIYWVIDL